MNRYTRDQIIHRALDQLDSPTLDQKDRPGGVLHQNALSIGWLTDALDFMHHIFPWAATWTDAAITLPTSGDATLPADFVLDVRDGVICTSGTQGWRLKRCSGQQMISHRLASTTAGKPTRYCVLEGVIKLHPLPDVAYSGTIYYYKLPPLLEAATVPAFPSDLILIKYVKLAGLEWIRAIPSGSAEAYLGEQCALLQKTGLAHEPESTTLPLDSDHYRPAGAYDRTAWMGATTV